MTRTEIEEIYRQDVLDRNWWGNFPDPLEVLERICRKPPTYIG